MKNRRIATMQDFRDLVLDTLGQFVGKHDTEGIAEHLLSSSQHDGASYHSRILDQGTDDLVMVDDFWALARHYHHDTVARRGPEHAGPFYTAPPAPPEPDDEPQHVTPPPRHPAQTPHTRA